MDGSILGRRRKYVAHIIRHKIRNAGQRNPYRLSHNLAHAKAITLIRNGESNVEQISTAVGYTSRAAFAKAFKNNSAAPPANSATQLIHTNRLWFISESFRY